MSTPRKPSSANFGGFCVGDISVDDPQMSPSTNGVFNGGAEVIGNNLILDLKEDVARLTDELENELEQKRLEIEKSEFLVGRVSELETEVESQRQELENLSKLKTSEVEKLKQELGREKENLVVQTEKNVYLEGKVTNLQNRVEELESLATRKSEEVEELSRSKAVEVGKLKEDLDALVASNNDLQAKKTELENNVSIKSVEIQKLTSELEIERGRLASENGDILRKLSDCETQLVEQRQKFEEALNAKLSECKSLSAELEMLTQLRDSKAEEVWTLAEKISKLESQVEAQESTIREQSEMMKSQALQFEEVMGKSSSEYSTEVQKYEVKMAELKKQVKAREEDNDKLMEMLHLKAIEFEKLTKDFEREKATSETDLQQNFAADVRKQREDFEAERSTLKSKISDLEAENGDYKRKSGELYASLTEAMTELADCRNKLEEFSHSAKRELLEKEKVMEAKLEEKVSAVRAEKEELVASQKAEFFVAAKEIKDLKEGHKKALKDKDDLIDSLKLDFEAQVNILKAENDQLKQKLQESKSDEELERRITEIKDECKKASEAALAEQKVRYKVRLNEVVENIKGQYKKEIEKSVTKWTTDFKAKDEKLADFKVKLTAAEAEMEKLKKEAETCAGNYEIAKQKLREFSDQVESKENLLSSEKALLAAKYEKAKKIILELQERVKSRDTQVESQKLLIDQLRKEVSVSGVKTEAPVAKDVFKHPGSLAANTPGQA